MYNKNNNTKMHFCRVHCTEISKNEYNFTPDINDALM